MNPDLEYYRKVSIRSYLGTWRGRSTVGNKDRRTWGNSEWCMYSLLHVGRLPRFACTSVFNKY
jgi:hypothetical protein